MRTTILEAGQHVLTDAQALYLLGRIESFSDDGMMGTLSVEGQTYEFPMVPGLQTAESDIMYGRLIETPAGLVRAESFMAIIPFDTEPCLTTHPQGPFWGVLDLAEDTELEWGPGWYRLAGQDRVDLMLPQLTELAFGYGADDPVEPLTHDEIVAMGFSKHGFHNSTIRYHGDIGPLVDYLRRGGHDGVVAKLERLRAAGAEEIFERLVLPPVTDERPSQMMPVPHVVGMCSGQASLFGVPSHPDNDAIFGDHLDTDIPFDDVGDVEDFDYTSLDDAAIAAIVADHDWIVSAERATLLGEPTLRIVLKAGDGEVASYSNPTVDSLGQAVRSVQVARNMGPRITADQVDAAIVHAGEKGVDVAAYVLEKNVVTLLLQHRTTYDHQAAILDHVDPVAAVDRAVEALQTIAAQTPLAA